MVAWERASGAGELQSAERTLRVEDALTEAVNLSEVRDNAMLTLRRYAEKSNGILPLPT